MEPRRPRPYGTGTLCTAPDHEDRLPPTSTPLPPTAALSRSTPVGWRRLGRAALVALAIIGVVLVFLVVGPTIPDGFAWDSRAYWGFPRDPLYAVGASANGYTLYRYSPAFVPLLQLFTFVPWPVFAVGWAFVTFGVYRWLAGPNWLPLLAFTPFVYEVYMGNIHMLLAAAIVFGFRYPATWSFLLLTKVTPGVGLLWFAVRREWRSLAIALGVTGAIVLGGLLVAPDAWRDWFRSLAETSPATSTNALAVPLSVRLVAAAVLVTVGAATDRYWTVPVAAMLGLPTLWDHSFAMLVGAVALHRGMGLSGVQHRLATAVAADGRRVPWRSRQAVGELEAT